WLREVESVNINEGVNSLREAFRTDAIESNVFDRAKGQVRDLMNTMFTPLVRQIGEQYKIEVEFTRAPSRTTQGELG
ncbi:MAG: DUF4230 domain-containing protein, partial [Bacteroidota bacterium]